MSATRQRAARWARRLAWFLAGLVVLVALLVIGLEVAVRQPSVRRAVQERLGDLVAERTGLLLEIGDLRASLLRGVVEVDGLTLGSPGERAILETERIEVQTRLSSIWQRPLTLERLTITGPRLDLEAPLPSMPTASEQGDSEFALGIERFELMQGRIDGPVLPVELRSWIEEWWMEDLTVEGWYGPQGLEVDLDSRLRWQRSDDVLVEIALEAELEGPQSGPWDLTRMSLRGDGLEAEATATLDPSMNGAVHGSFDLQFEPHRLIPVPPSQGPVQAQGQFDTGLKSGSLQLAAVDVPIELASPWLPADSRDSALVAGLTLSAEADLEMAGQGPGPSGRVDLLLSWQRETTLATGIVELSSETSFSGAKARIEAEILPDRAGSRSLHAVVDVPEWTQLDQVSLSEGKFEITETDLSLLRDELAKLTPVPLPEALDTGMVGVLEAKGTVSGPLAGLQLDLEADWTAAEIGVLELRAAASTEQVTLESISGKIGERRFSGRARIDLPTPIRGAEARIQVHDLLPEVPELDLSLELLNGVAQIVARPETPNGVTSTITARVPLASLRDLPEIGEALPDLPITLASGPVRVDWQVPQAEWVDWISEIRPELALSSLRLGSRGSVQFDLSRPLAGSGRLVVENLGIAGRELDLASEGPMAVRLDKGQLILEPARLRTAGGLLEIEAWTELATRWQPEDPLTDLIERFRIDANGAAPLALLQGLVDDIYTDGDLQVALSVFGSPEELNGEIRVDGLEAELRFGDPEGLRVANPSLQIDFEGDQIRLTRAALDVEGAKLSAAGEVPLATVLQMLDDETMSDRQPLEPLTLSWEMGEAEWAESLSKLGMAEPPESLVLAARGELSANPARLLETRGWLEVAPLRLSAQGHQVRNDGPLRLDLRDGRLELTSLGLLADDQPFRLTGSLELDRSWSPERSATELIEALSLQGGGTFAAVLLNPFLAGGSADGLLQVDLEVTGTPEDPQGQLKLRGPDASVFFVAPYVAKIEAPELDLELVGGRAVIEDGRLRLNGGDVELAGTLGLDGADLFAAFDGLRFRLDHGLLVRLDGELDLALKPKGQSRLSGEIIVDQGSLTRPISIDRDLLTDLLTPIDLTGTEASPLEDIELDLALKTRRGVLVRNNVADLAVQWDEVRVRGNLLQPVIDGKFRVEPGGRAFLFGQTLRIDRGVMTFSGRAGEEAILDLETTSSLDDPGISRLAGDDALSLGEVEAAGDLESRARDAGWSAAAFVSEQLATRIAEAVPAARFTFRPILIFGEADPGARLTIGRDFSRYVTLAASIDLRNAENQTYLMDAHNFPRLPGLVVQIFTNDQEQEGFTLQHRLRFGSYRRTAPTGPMLRKLAIDEVPRVSARALRRSVGLAKGDRASADDLFLAEVEVLEFLRAKGYTDAQVEVRARTVPERPRKVDLEISIEPGPWVQFEFSGEELPRALKRSITPLYRSDFYEPSALAEMEIQTVRALRSLGFLFPTVQISVEEGEDPAGREERTVSIFSMGGDQVTLESLDLAGLSETETSRVSEVFRSRLQRVELATAEPSADRRLLSAVRSLGYPEPKIVDRRVSEDRRSLTVTIEPGPLQYLDRVVVQGVAAEEASRLREAAALRAGNIARRDRIAAGAIAIESDLRSRGFVNVSVRTRLETAQPDSEGGVELVYEVETGTAFTVADTDISGLRSTSRRWATNVAELESGAPLREDEVAAARSRLYETGLFTMVRSDSILTEGGETEVVFDVEERPRFSAAYGLRWDSDEGSQGVVDVVDQNFLGRSVTLGLRGLYKQDDWSVRLGAGVPRLLGSRAALELFASYRDLFEEVTTPFATTLFDEQITEVSLQLAYPFGAHIWGRLYGRYRTRESVVTDIDEDPIFPLPPSVTTDKTKTPLIGTLWIYDSRDRELVLARGSFASLDLSGPGKFLDSDFEYVRMFAQFNLFRPVMRLAKRRVNWAQSLRLGLADSFDQELFRGDRFFAGGQYSVRGYPTNSLGPLEDLEGLTRPLGGKTLVVINQELRFDLLGPVAGLVFLDLGNVWEDTAEFSSDLSKSLGFGFRAVTPVGLLRLDFAFPLDRREDDPSSQIYFGFGNTF